MCILLFAFVPLRLCVLAFTYSSLRSLFDYFNECSRTFRRGRDLRLLFLRYRLPLPASESNQHEKPKNDSIHAGDRPRPRRAPLRMRASDQPAAEDADTPA